MAGREERRQTLVCQVDAGLDLVHLERDDAENLVNLSMDDSRFATVQRAQRFLETYLQHFAAGRVLPCAIRCEGTMVGYMFLEFMRIPQVMELYPEVRRVYEDACLVDGKEAQLHYGLTPSERGRGIATRAAAALVNHAFRNLDVVAFRLGIPVSNIKSCEVVQRLGFADKGIWMLCGQEHRLFFLQRDVWERDRDRTDTKVTKNPA